MLLPNFHKKKYIKKKKAANRKLIQRVKRVRMLDIYFDGKIKYMPQIRKV